MAIFYFSLADSFIFVGNDFYFVGNALCFPGNDVMQVMEVTHKSQLKLIF